MFLQDSLEQRPGSVLSFEFWRQHLGMWFRLAQNLKLSYLCLLGLEVCTIITPDSETQRSKETSQGNETQTIWENLYL